jgi:hypothetical protein
MMKRETLQAEKAAARERDYQPSRQFAHSVIDSHLEALDLIDGGTKADNRAEEVRKALDDVRDKIAAGETRKAHFMLGVVMSEMLSTDYRRYPTWADQQPRIDEEFGGVKIVTLEEYIAMRSERRGQPKGTKYCPDCGAQRDLGFSCQMCGNTL